MRDEFGYYPIEGKDRVSVTTVLSLIDKPGLRYWFGKHGTTECNRLSKLAAGIGTDLHSYDEYYFGEAEVPPQNNNPQYLNAVKNYHRFMDLLKPKNIVGNLLVHNEDGEDTYAGTLDRIMETGPYSILWDYKTSSEIYDEYIIQVNAYYGALAYCVRKGIIKIDRLPEKVGILRLDKEEEFNPEKDILVLDPDKKILETFFNLLKSFNGLHNLKQYRKETHAINWNDLK